MNEQFLAGFYHAIATQIRLHGDRPELEDVLAHLSLVRDKATEAEDKKLLTQCGYSTYLIDSNGQ